MFNCAPHFDYKTTFTPRLNQAYLVDFQSYYVRICSFACDPFCVFKKGSRVGNLIDVQTRTFSESKEQKKVCKSTTYTLFEQLRTVLSGERGIRTPGPVTVNGFQDRRIRPLCHLSLRGCKYNYKKIYFKKISPKIRKNLNFAAAFHPSQFCRSVTIVFKSNN